MMGLFAKVRKYKRIIVNFFSLSLINGVSYIIALFLIPYLLRVLGEERYGSYLIIYVIAQYLLLVGNYGFRFSVTRLVSVHRDDKEKVNAIFNATIWARVLLSVVASAVGLLIVYLLMDGDDVVMYLFALGMVFGDILIPSWLFQGMEQMKYLTIVNVVSKLVFALLIFVFITSPSQYKYVLLLHSMGYIASGVLSMYLAKKQFGMRLGMTTFAEIRAQLKDGWHIFVSNIGMEVYRNSNVVLLGTFVGDAAAGIYGAVEKLIKAAQTIINALPMAIYPYVSRLFYNSETTDNVSKLFRIVKWAFLLLLPITIAIGICNPIIAAYLKLPEETICGIVWIIAPALLFGCMNYIVGIVGLVNLDASAKFQKNIWIAGITSVTLMILTCKEYTYYAAAAAWTWAEFILFVLCVLSLKRIKAAK
ncbi:MAG: oligosaccharide flippase family protein [Bacteroidaceae bacterium]|nr:oligosaccharide flippase family protein [Bacteroidaceae bacterium]